jgi:hypothetical protein
MARVGRFQVMAALQTARALALCMSVDDWSDAQDVTAAADRQGLESQHRSCDEVYKPRRDELVKRWSG